MAYLKAASCSAIRYANSGQPFSYQPTTNCISNGNARARCIGSSSHNCFAKKLHPLHLWLFRIRTLAVATFHKGRPEASSPRCARNATRCPPSRSLPCPSRSARETRMAMGERSRHSRHPSRRQSIAHDGKARRMAHADVDGLHRSNEDVASGESCRVERVGRDFQHAPFAEHQVSPAPKHQL